MINHPHSPLKMKNKKQEKKQTLQVKICAEFNFVHYENVERVALALALAGYLVSIRGSSPYRLDVYSYNL